MLHLAEQVQCRLPTNNLVRNGLDPFWRAPRPNLFLSTSILVQLISGFLHRGVQTKLVQGNTDTMLVRQALRRFSQVPSPSCM